MIPVLLLLIPLVSGLITFFIRNANVARNWSLISSFATLVVSLLAVTVLRNNASLNVNAEWMAEIGGRFALAMDGMSNLLCLLTAIAMPLVFIATYRRQYANANSFFALMLLTQAGIMGVFLSADALLFYFFWELALIPTYFLCSRWGGERRIPVTFKFCLSAMVAASNAVASPITATTV